VQSLIASRGAEWQVARGSDLVRIATIQGQIPISLSDRGTGAAK
jgi:hypothetical protein